MVVTQFRFIPTAVGNTHSTTIIPQPNAVHPHGCGEHSSLDNWTMRQDGSSPRLWGTLIEGFGKKNLQRFIPTAVGNTLITAQRWKPKTVHPHGCGEHDIKPGIKPEMTGSSPRLWGTRYGNYKRN